MKYQSQHDLMDPDVPPQDVNVDAGTNADPDGLDDAYVIGENGSTNSGSSRPPSRWRRCSSS
jgi:hypothetical protein